MIGCCIPIPCAPSPHAGKGKSLFRGFLPRFLFCRVFKRIWYKMFRAGRCKALAALAVLESHPPRPVGLIFAAALVSFLVAIGASPVAVALPDESVLSDPVFARPGCGDLAQAFLKKTRYLLALDVDFAAGQLAGRARVLFVNQTPDSLNKAVFRLYPNHPWYTLREGKFKRRMAITSVAVDGRNVAPTVRDPWETVLDVPFVSPLPPGGLATIDFDYHIDYRVNGPLPESYLILPEPYPLLAVYEDGQWREDVATNSLDTVYSETALYAVRLRTSGDVSMWSTGAIKDEWSGPEANLYTITTGPVREFVLVLGKNWDQIDVAGPVPIHVHYLGSAENAQIIADTAVDAMNYYDAHFGPYPYVQLDITAMKFDTGGEEYPTLIFCNIIGVPNYLRFIAAHEVAHQWFYGVAGDDIVRHAWLDESLAQISGYLFYEAVYGSDRAESEYWPHILTWARRIQGKPRLIDTPLDDFSDQSEYMQTIYGEGAVFMRDLGKLMGEDRFIAGLRDYYCAAFLGVGTPRQFFGAMQARTDIDLAPTFCQRVGIMC
jgi:hypothetical protein